MVGLNQLYKVDMHKDHTITLVPVDEFQHVSWQLWVVFQSQSNDEPKSDVHCTLTYIYTGECHSCEKLHQGFSEHQFYLLFFI